MTRFFTSDTHFGHPFVAALRGYGKTDEEPNALRERVRAEGRDFADYVDCRKHDETIINNFNSMLTVDDELYILGDLSSGGRSSMRAAIACVKRLNVPRKRLHLILGNHDPLEKGTRADLDRLLEVFSSVSRDEVIVIDGHNVALSHFQFRHHFDGVEDSSISRNGRSTKYEEYAVVDDGSLLLLHGHTHSKTPFEFENPREMNVGIDAWGRPVSEDEVIRYLIEPNKGVMDAPLESDGYTQGTLW